MTIFLTLRDNVVGWVKKAQTDKVMRSIILINAKFSKTNSDVAVVSFKVLGQKPVTKFKKLAEHFTEIGDIKTMPEPGTPPTDGLPFP
jgi:hypothetical protein